MKISQMSSGSAIIIEVQGSGPEPTYIKTEALFPMGGGLLVKKPSEGSMDVQGQMRLTIHNKKDDRSYVFNRLSISPMDTQYGLVYMIKSDEEGEGLCRRKAERYDILCMGTMAHRDFTGNVIIYDMSMRGVAVITGVPNIGKVGDIVTIRFRDGQGFHSYVIEAEIVRYFEVKGKAAIGCKVAAMPFDIMQLLEKKKLEGKAK